MTIKLTPTNLIARFHLLLEENLSPGKIKHFNVQLKIEMVLPWGIVLNTADATHCEKNDIYGKINVIFFVQDRTCLTKTVYDSTQYLIDS